jgi:hypothetical protein
MEQLFDLSQLRPQGRDRARHRGRRPDAARLGRPGRDLPRQGFGASALELELRVWIEDPQNGVSNVKSNIYLRLLERLTAAAIEIPYAQHDVHARQPVTARVEASCAAEGAMSRAGVPTILLKPCQAFGRF